MGLGVIFKMEKTLFGTKWQLTQLIIQLILLPNVVHCFRCLGDKNL